MIFTKFWRAIRGHIDEDELRSRVKPYVAPSTQAARYQDDDKEDRKEAQRHINEANSALFRLRTQQVLRRREY
jgi:hypothetical protein